MPTQVTIAIARMVAATLSVLSPTKNEIPPAAIVIIAM
jgi:hypothetical protein